jgi:hypothetical protein
MRDVLKWNEPLRNARAAPFPVERPNQTRRALIYVATQQSLAEVVAAEQRTTQDDTTVYRSNNAPPRPGRRHRRHRRLLSL